MATQTRKAVFYRIRRGYQYYSDTYGFVDVSEKHDQFCTREGALEELSLLKKLPWFPEDAVVVKVSWKLRRKV